MAFQGGRADESYRLCDVQHLRQLRWASDVVSPDNGGKELLGDLLCASFQDCLIYEDTACPVKFYFDRGNLNSTEKQCVGSLTTHQHVCVYHSREETFVAVRADGSTLQERRPTSAGQAAAAAAGNRPDQDHQNQQQQRHVVPSWNFFSRMRVRDLITMLQPNYTEIVEGKVQKFNIKEEGGTHKWYELLAQWACLDNIDERLKVTLLRSRYLILSKLGEVSGHIIRQEMFEERFGEVRRGEVGYLVLPECLLFASL